MVIHRFKEEFQDLICHIRSQHTCLLCRCTKVIFRNRFLIFDFCDHAFSYLAADHVLHNHVPAVMLGQILCMTHNTRNSTLEYGSALHVRGDDLLQPYR